MWNPVNKLFRIFIFLFIVTLSRADAQVDFISIDDNGEKEFTKAVKLFEISYKIKRSSEIEPTYDDNLGKTLLSVKKQLSGKSPIQLLRILVDGQFHIFGFDAKDLEIYCYGLKQCGANLLIDDIVVFCKNSPAGNAWGIDGQYQFASWNPQKSYCLLLNNQLYVLDGATKKVKIIKTNIPLTGTDADPTKETSSSVEIGGNYNLSGDYLKMIWQTEHSGKLIINEYSSKETREYEINLHENPI